MRLRRQRRCQARAVLSVESKSGREVDLKVDSQGQTQAL